LYENGNGAFNNKECGFDDGFLSHPYYIASSSFMLLKI